MDTDMNTDIELAEGESVWRNFYRHCGEEWDDTWSCKCNDECPKCGKEIDPYISEYVNKEIIL